MEVMQLLLKGRGTGNSWNSEIEGEEESVAARRPDFTFQTDWQLEEDSGVERKAALTGRMSR